MKPSIHQRRHGHQHLHTQHQENKRAVGDVVTATYNGNVFTFTNEYNGQAPTEAPEPQPYSAPKPAPADADTNEEGSETTSSHTSKPSVNAGVGKWGRQAFYNAKDGSADGLTFLNNLGGQKSGVFD